MEKKMKRSALFGASVLIASKTAYSADLAPTSTPVTTSTPATTPLVVGVDRLVMDEAPGTNAKVCYNTATKSDASAMSADSITIAPTAGSTSVQVTFTVGSILPSATQKPAVLFLVYSNTKADKAAIPTKNASYPLLLGLDTAGAPQVLAAYNVPAFSDASQAAVTLGQAKTAPSTRLTFTVDLDMAQVNKLIADSNNKLYFQAGLMPQEDFAAGKFTNMILSEVDTINFKSSCSGTTNVSQGSSKTSGKSVSSGGATLCTQSGSSGVTKSGSTGTTTAPTPTPTPTTTTSKTATPTPTPTPTSTGCTPSTTSKTSTTPTPTPTGLAEVRQVSVGSAPIPPSDMNVGCFVGSDDLAASSTTCPVISYNGVDFWPFYYKDNRFSVGLVGYKSGKVVRTLELKGTRYVWKATVDTTAKTVSIFGKGLNGGGSVSASWENLDGCFTRNGLTWELKTPKGTGLHDSQTVFTNFLGLGAETDANGVATGLSPQYGSSTDVEGFVKAVNAERLCGYSDWRRATKEELVSLADSGRPPSADFYSAAPFSWFSWSSSRDVSGVWGVGIDGFTAKPFFDIVPLNGSKTSVRLVRTAP